MATAPYNSHRRLLDTILQGMPPTSPNKAISSYNSEANIDSNMVIVLAALLCAIICALGLNSIIRCAIRYGYRFLSATAEQATPRLPSIGLNKSTLNQIPVMVYGSGLNFPVTDCPICLGEFVEGENARILPKCNHGFHVKCIDIWLASHSSCPLCRQQLFDHPTSCNVEEDSVNISLPETGQS
ncbi:zf-RING_2 domain-containing protein [Cephalotus follicularis]|uniref:RING-type E3 ubiquitin transferase n=1 Tax=Cephalotus follicularis TaxID=3775 RepID=A0A1Q3ASA1_CEPFO|nr:zf-RING_2 domain-containing protein [Cephalotus follicularis]